MSDLEPELAPSRRVRLREVAGLFLRLGFTAFGGPAAHIALMESEVVRRRKWLTPEAFLDRLGAVNLIPGPSSSELAVFIGYERAGALGLVVAGLCFVLPAAAMSGAIAWAYVRFGSLPATSGVLYGVKPVVVAVVAQALWTLAPKAVKRAWLVLLGVAAGIAFALGVDAVAALAGAGIIAMLARPRARNDEGKGDRPAGAFFPALAAISKPVTGGLAPLFFTFLKLGSVVFGSGYVLLAFLRADLVDRFHWLTDAQVIDAVAVGQITPGPVFTTATFIGYLVAGWPGAIVATIGIFLPGFALVGVLRPLVVRMRASPTAGAFLDGVNVAALALMAVVTLQLARAAIVDVPTIAIAVVSAAVLLRFKNAATWLVAGAAVLGVVAR